MERRRGLRALLLAVVAGAGLVVPAPASTAASAASLTALKAQAIYFLRTGNEERRELVVDSMSALSAREGELWEEFLESWATINRGMAMNRTVPKALPSKGHVFVVLGSALSKSGRMTTKLQRRLTLALAAARKYPHSAVLVSGGAPRDGHTEAGVMSAWLKAHGVASSRILVEKKSPSTVGNAVYSMAMLAKLPKYTSYSLISDSSHLRRASILFRAATLRVQEETGASWGIRQLANVAYPDMATAGRTMLSSSSIGYTATNVASVLRLLPTYSDVLGDPPSAPEFTSLRLTPPAKRTYAVGEALDTTGLVVRALYDKGVYTRVVTGDASLTGFDTSAVRDGTATARFTDGVTRTAGFDYTVVKAAGVLDWRFSTKSVRASRTRVTVAATASAPHRLVPTGKVRYYLDGKRLKTLTLTADAGTVRFTYPRISTPGAHRFVVTYSGDDRISSARKAVTLRVTA